MVIGRSAVFPKPLNIVEQGVVNHARLYGHGGFISCLGALHLRNSFGKVGINQSADIRLVYNLRRLVLLEHEFHPVKIATEPGYRYGGRVYRRVNS